MSIFEIQQSVSNILSLHVTIANCLLSLSSYTTRVMTYVINKDSKYYRKILFQFPYL